MSIEEQEKAAEIFIEIVRAYETLTDEVKYDNYLRYGNPDGSKSYRAIEVALPGFLFKEEYKSLVLGAFFIGFICMPIALVFI